MIDKNTADIIEVQISTVEAYLTELKQKLITANDTKHLYRLEYYFEIVEKEKKYLNDLIKSIEDDNHEEIYRLVYIIEELSIMLSTDVADAMMAGQDKPIDPETLH